MNSHQEATLRDSKYISEISKGLDLNNPEDIEKIYSALQSGGYYFESETGRNFDDQIYELHQKVLNGQIESPVNKDKKVKSTRKSDNKRAEEKNSDRYGDSINALVEAELKKRELKRRLLIALASIVAAASLGYFGYYYYMSSRTSDEYENLAELKGSDVLANDDPERFDHVIIVNHQEIVLPDMLEEYKTLYSKNRKLAGWLKIEGTKIDYPVMQTTDNEYYLNHNFNQEKDNNGALFLDCNCNIYPKSTNMIIYGHHMKSGNMFGNLQRYAKESYYKEHKEIQFDTIYEKGTYEVMYTFYSKVYDNDELVFKYYQFTNANSEAEFQYYMDEMAKMSLYDTGVTAKYGDTLLTLSTCDHSQTDGRFAVVAKKVN